VSSPQLDNYIHDLPYLGLPSDPTAVERLLTGQACILGLMASPSNHDQRTQARRQRTEKTKPHAQPGPEEVLDPEKVAKLVATSKITEDGARS
jgi:hypothetical protein